MPSVCEGSAWFALIRRLRSTPSLSASLFMSTFSHLPDEMVAKSGERMYITSLLRPSMIISIVGSAPPSADCACGGIEKRMFNAPECECPSKTPLPLNDMPPAPATSIVAVNATRDDVVSAVLLAALATGSNESASPPQPASAAEHAATH